MPKLSKHSGCWNGSQIGKINPLPDQGQWIQSFQQPLLRQPYRNVTSPVVYLFPLHEFRTHWWHWLLLHSSFTAQLVKLWDRSGSSVCIDLLLFNPGIAAVLMTFPEFSPPSVFYCTPIGSLQGDAAPRSLGMQVFKARQSILQRRWIWIPSVPCTLIYKAFELSPLYCSAEFITYIYSVYIYIILSPFVVGLLEFYDLQRRGKTVSLFPTPRVVSTADFSPIPESKDAKIILKQWTEI